MLCIKFSLTPNTSVKQVPQAPISKSTPTPLSFCCFRFFKEYLNPQVKILYFSRPLRTFSLPKILLNFLPSPLFRKAEENYSFPQGTFFENLFPPSRKGRYRIFNKKLDKVRELVSNLRVLDKNCLEILQIFPELTFSEWSENP